MSQQDPPMFDAIDWRLTLYENGEVGYDDTIWAIIADAKRLIEGSTDE